MRKGQPELLAPAGSYEGVKAAAAAGADAVYTGGTKFSARAFARNLSEEQMLQAIDKLHMQGKKLYLTLNTLLKNQEMEEVSDYIGPLYEQGLDGVIIQDLGVVEHLQKNFPGLALHASTQMTITGLSGIHFLEKLGIKRTVLARELSIREIGEICQNTDMEIECFVHGALCYCYSGQCLMSSLLGGRSGNRGRCAQPCRLPYQVTDGSKRLNKKDAPYLLSPRDICLLPLLPELIDAGVTSFKIEGRMKRAEYTAGVVHIYRKYMDLYAKEGCAGYRVDPKDMALLEKLYTRSGFSEGYLHQHNGAAMITASKPDYASADEALFQKFRALYEGKTVQLPVQGQAMLRKGQPVTLEVHCREADVKAEGAVVQRAMKQPLSEEKVRSQLTKTGGTAFAFTDLKLSMEPDVFLPVQELNALRREALEQLETKLLAGWRRVRPTGPAEAAVNGTKPQDAAASQIIGRAIEPNVMAGVTQSSEPAQQSGTHKAGMDAYSGSPVLTASVETVPQLQAVLEAPGIADVYLSSRLFFPAGAKRGQRPENALFQTYAGQVHRAGKQCFYSMPEIFREEMVSQYRHLIPALQEAGFDGILVHGMDELEWCREQGWQGEVRSDAALYVMNEEANACVKRYVSQTTLSVEANEKELRHMDASASEMIVYGYLPLMVSAQCVNQTLHRCNQKEETRMLIDRYQKCFPVKKDCTVCMNIIYNSTPLVLLDMAASIGKIAPKSVRLAFTRETQEETRKVLRAGTDAFLKGKTVDPGALGKEYTRGHFRRGVD